MLSLNMMKIITLVLSKVYRKRKFSWVFIFLSEIVIRGCNCWRKTAVLHIITPYNISVKSIHNASVVPSGIFTEKTIRNNKVVQVTIPILRAITSLYTSKLFYLWSLKTIWSFELSIFKKIKIGNVGRKNEISMHNILLKKFIHHIYETCDYIYYKN